jgi:hypothetical protein
MVREHCSATTAKGQPCQAFALPGETLCFSHHPDKAGEVKEAQRRGGANRSNARRAAKTLAMTGRQIRADELPEIVKACILRVIAGTMEPGQASAVASLARTSLQLSHDLELEQRITQLEEAAGIMPPNVRRLSA